MIIRSYKWTRSKTPSRLAPALRLLNWLAAILSLNIGLDIDPEQGSADSGDLEIDLPNLFVAVAEAAEERKSAVAVLIDEIQYPACKGVRKIERQGSTGATGSEN